MLSKHQLMYLVIVLAAEHGVVRNESENHHILRRKLMTNTMSAKDEEGYKYTGCPKKMYLWNKTMTKIE